MPQLIKVETVLHKAYTQGPRIERIEFYEFEDQITRVEFWYDNGKLVYIR